MEVGTVIKAVLACAVFGGLSGSGKGHPASYEVLLSWKMLDFQWSTPEMRERLWRRGEFIPENNVITGIKVWGSQVFLTVPRWREGVPSTLNVVDLKGARGPGEGPLLVPYPSWEMQQVGDCEAFQYVQSMEIDRLGRLWVLDVGRVSIFTKPEVKCRAKVVLVDLASDKVIHKYEFPEEVVSPQTNFLNDVVLDCKVTGGPDECYAYMTDSEDGKLVVYNLKEDRSWYVHHRSMRADLDATEIEILGKNYTFHVNIDGIALSPRSQGHDRVYYCPMSSYALYSVPTALLKEAGNGETLQDKDVTTLIKRRASQSDGLAMDANGLLFYGSHQNNSVVYVDTTAAQAAQEALWIQNEVDLEWSDTFAFDNTGYLYVVTNKIHRFSTNSLNWGDVNFRVVRTFIGSWGYQYDNSRQRLRNRGGWGNKSPQRWGHFTLEG